MAKPPQNAVVHQATYASMAIEDWLLNILKRRHEIPAASMQPRIIQAEQ